MGSSALVVYSRRTDPIQSRRCKFAARFKLVTAEVAPILGYLPSSPENMEK
jgi:hypothetical protein